MKHLTSVIVLAVVLLGLAAGCSAKHKVDVSKLTKGFAAASAELKTQADSAVKAIKEENYPAAVGVIEKMAEVAGLTADQKQALVDTLVDIQVIVSEKPPADADALFQKIQDLQMKLM
jgi:hypothetical protein